MATIDNALACQAWLDYLAKSEAGVLLGKINSELSKVASMYSICDTYMDYYAEVPLCGEAGIDLSGQYCVDDFLEKNLLLHPRMLNYGEVLHNYGQLLSRLLPQVLPDCYCFLETDTASGAKDKTALFLNMTGPFVKQILPEVMKWCACEDRLENVQKVLDFLQPEMSLWHLGFMFSRTEMPIRLVLYPDSFNVQDIVQALIKMGENKQAELVERLLLTLEPLRIFDFILDIDILPDGTVGETVGLELLLKPVTPTQQQELFRSDKWQKALELLRKEGCCDERISVLERCVFSSLAPDSLQAPYQMYSRISHFKLRWRKEAQLPTKVYLQLKTRVLQSCINDIKRLVNR